jgi:hypothetical protein
VRLVQAMLLLVLQVLQGLVVPKQRQRGWREKLRGRHRPPPIRERLVLQRLPVE